LKEEEKKKKQQKKLEQFIEKNSFLVKNGFTDSKRNIKAL